MTIPNIATFDHGTHGTYFFGGIKLDAKMYGNFQGNSRKTISCIVWVPVSYDQWLFLVPLKGGIGGIVHPPIGRKYTTYIPLIVLAFWGGEKFYRYHLLGEPFQQPLIWWPTTTQVMRQWSQILEGGPAAQRPILEKERMPNVFCWDETAC